VNAPLYTFTAFCRQHDNWGTTWIDTVEAAGIDQALAAAVTKCAAAWGWPESDVICIGLAEGDIKIAYWIDEND
jgi:hydroxymethylpyrimidine pyrophosphatase-like HAD family hydrolase